MKKANHELRISNLEEWVVEFTNFISDTLPPDFAEDLQQLTMRLMSESKEIRVAKNRGETIVTD